MTETNTDKARTRTLERLFSDMLAPENIIITEEARRAYECDGLSAYSELPSIVLLPETVGQIQDILKCCNVHNVPVVTRGAGTGLSGGALPHKSGVLLVLSKMNRILDIDLENRTATVEPGVRNLAISDAVSADGLYYAPDPSSQIACSIGGNVAENAGGVHCLKYGLTVNNVQKLKIVTAGGDLITLGGSGLDGPGYDLLALMTGSEGMLAVVVEITVRLLPKPASTLVMLAAYDSIESAGNAVTGVISAGIIPSGLEMMDSAALQAAEAFAHAGYPTNAQAIVICELDGTREETDSAAKTVNAILSNHGAVSVTIASEEKEKQRLWAGRKAAFPAVGRISPDYYCMDGTIPRRQLAFVLARISELSRQYKLPVANVFHAGDGNLHPLILYDANKPGELEKTEELGGKILELCVAVGGTITGEHGVGMEKINQMCAQFQDHELEQFHRLKAAFDPVGILNPGKAIPTLSRCAEFGAMHVHEGRTRFPELERF